jgi:hypothetical protein
MQVNSSNCNIKRHQFSLNWTNEESLGESAASFVSTPPPPRGRGYPQEQENSSSSPLLGCAFLEAKTPYPTRIDLSNVPNEFILVTPSEAGFVSHLHTTSRDGEGCMEAAKRSQFFIPIPSSPKDNTKSRFPSLRSCPKKKRRLLPRPTLRCLFFEDH